MAEIRTVTTLRRKRDEIAASVRLYERQLDSGPMTTKEFVEEINGGPEAASEEQGVVPGAWHEVSQRPR